MVSAINLPEFRRAPRDASTSQTVRVDFEELEERFGTTPTSLQEDETV